MVTVAMLKIVGLNIFGVVVVGVNILRMKFFGRSMIV